MAKSRKFNENRDRTILQKDFSRRLAGSTGLSIKTSEMIVQAVLSELKSCMMDGLCVKFMNFGTFGAFKQKGRIVYGGIANDRCECKDRFAVKFRPSKKLNAIVNRGISRSSTFV